VTQLVPVSAIAVRKWVWYSVVPDRVDALRKALARWRRLSTRWQSGSRPLRPVRAGPAKCACDLL